MDESSTNTLFKSTDRPVYYADSSMIKQKRLRSRSLRHLGATTVLQAELINSDQDLQFLI